MPELPDVENIRKTLDDTSSKVETLETNNRELSDMLIRKSEEIYKI
jgi:formamidopyrimidine-DNA glycosylase